MTPALRELYQEVILDHNKSPRNFRKMENADRAVDGYNPLCGDRYTVYLKMEDGVIKDISFEGAGCAISKASASVMTSSLKGKTKQEAEALFEEFQQLVKGEHGSADNDGNLGKLEAFSGVSEFPTRVKCAILAWHALHSALETKEEVISTE